MSIASRLRQSSPKPPASRSRKRSPYKPAPLDITAMQREANRLNIEPKHIIIGRKGGKIPGIPFANRKYPHGKHAVAVSP